MKIVITGATGSIGSALALRYANGAHSLVLQGRNEALLKNLERACAELGATVQLEVFDLTDSARLQLWINELLADDIPDLVFANAGMNINTGADQQGESWSDIDKLLDLNVKSVVQLVHHMALAMKKQGRGQLVLMSSLAAYHGLAVTPSYCASKAAIKAYGEALRGWLSDDNVGVTVVMPGYVKSNMCDEMPGPKPFLLSPDRAARIIEKGVAANRACISFPFPLNLGTWCLMLLPSRLSQWILKRLNYNG